MILQTIEQAFIEYAQVLKDTMGDEYTIDDELTDTGFGKILSIKDIKLAIKYFYSRPQYIYISIFTSLEVPVKLNLPGVITGTVSFLNNYGGNLVSINLEEGTPEDQTYKTILEIGYECHSAICDSYIIEAVVSKLVELDKMLIEHMKQAIPTALEHI